MSFQKIITTFAQAYGSDTYSSKTYSCTPGVTSCTTTQDATAPNTGFFSTPDAALTTAAGVLLVALAVVGIVFVVVSRLKHNKAKKTQNPVG